MKKLVLVLLWIATCFLMAEYIHWLLSILTPFVFVPWLKLDLRGSILAGFLVLFVVWFTAALVQDMRNDALLSNMVGDLLQVPSTILLFATGLIGAIGGSLISWLAYNIHTTNKMVFSSRNRMID